MPSFAILCVGRVGSEHLVSLLDSHPDITCFSEIFAPSWAIEYRRGTLDVPPFAETSHESATSYWNELVEGLGTPVLGLKLPGSSIKAHPDVVELISDPNVDIIRLSRRDRLAQYVSVWLAMESGVWHSREGGYDTDRIRVNVDDCLAGLDQIGEQEAGLDELAEGHRVFSLSYEELVDGTGLDGLQSFLGVERRELTSGYRRMRDRSLRDLIENFDELAAALEGTPYSRYLAEATKRPK